MTPTEMMVSPKEEEMLRGVFSLVAGRCVKPLKKSSFVKPKKLHLVDVATGGTQDVEAPRKHTLAEMVSQINVTSISTGTPARIRDLLMHRLPGLRMAA